MGACQSQEEREIANKSINIDKRMKIDQLVNQRTIKLLLLGTGECGKSTILKQMRILHDNGFSDAELLQQRAVVYSNIVQEMATILQAMTTLNIQLEDVERELDAKLVLDVMKSGDHSEPFNVELATALKNLWSDKGVYEEAYIRRSEFHLADSCKYFFDKIDTIAGKNYKPSVQDILFTRVKTTGIVEMKFKLKNADFRIFDVGGQRSERKKWIHCFEDVDAIIFITAISEYDQFLFEDDNNNRIIESMRLFESICNSKWFTKTSMILFLNKKDLFAEKIRKISINVAFPEYKGRREYEESVTFIASKFESLNDNPNKELYIHRTCATDTNQVQIILNNIIDMIAQTNLQDCGLY